MGRTTLSLFAAICFIGVAQGMYCPLVPFVLLSVYDTHTNQCPIGSGIGIGTGSSASYCCLRANSLTGVGCCEASEFFGVIFGFIVGIVVIILACCACYPCCPLNRKLCHRANATNFTMIQPAAYPGMQGQVNYGGGMPMPMQQTNAYA